MWGVIISPTYKNIIQKNKIEETFACYYYTIIYYLQMFPLKNN
jgi:hypothetical protein